jgi:hypothetical protein
MRISHGHVERLVDRAIASGQVEVEEWERRARMLGEGYSGYESM